jgi:hypothetical protein
MEIIHSRMKNRTNSHLGAGIGPWYRAGLRAGW